MNMTSTSISSPVQTLHETACRHGSHPRRQTIPPPGTKNPMGDHRNRDTSNKHNDFHLLEAHTNRGSISQPAICSAAQESSAVFFQLEHQNLSIVQRKYPPQKKQQQEIYPYKLCDICFSYLKTTSELQLPATSWWSFFSSPFSTHKGRVIYLIPPTGFPWWIFELVN